MWVCPRCGEPHDDHFHVCWKCAAEELRDEPTTPLPTPPVERNLRPASWILARAAVGFVIGTFLGVVTFHRYGASLVQASASALVVGVIFGILVAFFFWVFFPYEPATMIDNANSSRQDKDRVVGDPQD